MQLYHYVAGTPEPGAVNSTVAAFFMPPGYLEDYADDCLACSYLDTRNNIETASLLKTWGTGSLGTFVFLRLEELPWQPISRLAVPTPILRNGVVGQEKPDEKWFTTRVDKTFIPGLETAAALKRAEDGDDLSDIEDLPSGVFTRIIVILLIAVIAISWCLGYLRLPF